MKGKWATIGAPILVLLCVVGVFIFLGWLMIGDVHAATPPVPGQPQTYTEKYQCPFYENVDVKGCVVPPNLTCNADWSHCEMKKDDIISISPVETPPVASLAVEAPKKGTCTP